MNDWLNYKGSGSVRANTDILHSGYRTSAAKTGESSTYNKINADLDSFYSDLSVLLTARKNAYAAHTQFISAARNCKAKFVICTTLLNRANAKFDAISAAISNANISDMQKTALTNKLNNMINKHNSAAPGMNIETDFNTDTLNSLIDEINNNSKINRR